MLAEALQHVLERDRRERDVLSPERTVLPAMTAMPLSRSGAQLLVPVVGPHSEEASASLALRYVSVMLGPTVDGPPNTIRPRGRRPSSATLHDGSYVPPRTPTHH